ncbi:MAG TPA: DUF1491 family protein [Rhodobacteraceae bacterium]|nr:DUF1491 family protein [Paracoccaceae bacterium]
MPRLTAEFWVHAYLRRLNIANIPAFVVHTGDKTAGAVLVKSNPLDGSATLFHRTYIGDGKRIWSELGAGPELDMDSLIMRQRRFDPDLWVIEVEDQRGRTLLDEEGLFG